MKAFRFQLEAILKLREQAEQAAQQQCAKANAAVERAQARLQAADATLAAAHDLHREQLATGVQANQLLQLRAYITNLCESRIRLAREVAEAQAQLATATRQMIVATQRREVLERLRERKRREHEHHVAVFEQKMLDDFNGRGSETLQARNQPVPG